MTSPHLDDHDLSGHLDGAAADPHLSSCTLCSGRLAALGAARNAVAAAGVEPLPQSTIDEMVARAMAAADSAPVDSDDSQVGTSATVAPAGDLAARRGRRTPPPTWLITAAAAIAALAGVAGLLRATGGNDGQASLANGGGNGDLQGLESSSGGDQGELSPSAAAKAAGAAIDPEVVQVDLGDQDDPETLTAALSGRNSVVAENQAASPTRSEDSAASDEEGPAPPSPTATAAAGADRARCRSEAERIGAGRFARLISTSTVRWKATPAEVLVFSLTEPSGGVSRQAMVLARSNCALLADPQF